MKPRKPPTQRPGTEGHLICTSWDAFERFYQLKVRDKDAAPDLLYWLVGRGAAPARFLRLEPP